MIETTVNINIGIVEILANSADRIGVTKNTLVHYLFCKVIKEKRLSKPVVFRRVSYQKADPARQWKNEPITLRPDMYEKCHDLRRVLKLSVSFLLTYAIQTYLAQVIHELSAKSTEHIQKTYNSLSYYSMQSIFTTAAEGIVIKWTKLHKKMNTIPKACNKIEKEGR